MIFDSLTAKVKKKEQIVKKFPGKNTSNYNHKRPTGVDYQVIKRVEQRRNSGKQ